MSLASFSKVTLWLLVCLIKIQTGSLQLSVPRIPSTQTDSRIRAIANEIRSYHFDLAQDQISNLKDTSQIQQVIHAAYQYGPDSFVDILDFASSLTKIDLTFQVLKALRIEMVADGERDPLKLIALAKAFREYVGLQRNINSKALKEETIKIISEIESEVKISATQILAAAMLTNDFSAHSRAGQIAERMFSFYSLSEQVMQGMVNRTYALIPAIRIVETVMRSSKYIPQKVTVFLEVFNRLEEDNDLDNDAVLQIAYFLRKLLDQPNYENLYPSRKYDVNGMIDRLPACARNLFFTEEVCIWNRGKMEYLYAGREHLPQRRMYTSLPDDLLEGQGSWIVEKLSDDFLFKSQAYKKEYLGVANRKFDWVARYAQTNEKVRGLDDGSNTWTVELVGEYCYLKNQKFNEYLFASSKLNDKRQRLVVSARASADIDKMDFQWQIRDCS